MRKLKEIIFYVCICGGIFINKSFPLEKNFNFRSKNEVKVTFSKSHADKLLREYYLKHPNPPNFLVEDIEFEYLMLSEKKETEGKISMLIAAKIFQKKIFHHYAICQFFIDEKLNFLEISRIYMTNHQEDILAPALFKEIISSPQLEEIFPDIKNKVFSNNINVFIDMNFNYDEKNKILNFFFLEEKEALAIKILLKENSKGQNQAFFDKNSVRKIPYEKQRIIEK